MDSLIVSRPEGHVSVNVAVAPLLHRLVQDSSMLRIGVTRHASGATVIDAGIKFPGCLEAGRIITEICMGGMGTAGLMHNTNFKNWPWQICVHTTNPVLACLGSQYAGWRLSHQDFFALASGPGRALAIREPIFEELGYQDYAESTCLVLESDCVPPEEIIAKVAQDTRLNPDQLTFILTPTRSLSGVVQITGRVLEVAVHKIHALGFPLAHVVDGIASAPIPPPTPDFINGMGRTNDAILFGGQAQLFVWGSDQDAEQLAQSLPSSSSPDYGRPFAEIFKTVNMDFYQIDAMLFSPAAVTVTALESGNSFSAGTLDAALLERSFSGRIAVD